MKKFSYLVYWLVSLLVASCAPVSSGQLPVGSDPHLDLLVAQAQLTGTAQAFENLVVGYTLTAQSWTATPSPVPTFTMTPSITPTPTPNLTATLESAQVNATVTAINLNTEKKKISNSFYAVIAPIGILVVILIMAFALIQVARFFRKRPIERDARGDAKLIEDTVTGEIIDPDANPNYSTGKDINLAQRVMEHWLENNYGLKPLLPAITAERQDKAKENDQKIDLMTRGFEGNTKRTPAQKRLDPNNVNLLGGGQKLENRFQILSGEQYPPANLIDGQIVDVLEADWEAASK